MHLASKNNHLNCVKILVKNGANINAKDITGAIPLHYAAKVFIKTCFFKKGKKGYKISKNYVFQKGRFKLYS